MHSGLPVCPMLVLYTTYSKCMLLNYFLWMCHRCLDKFFGKLHLPCTEACNATNTTLGDRAWHRIVNKCYKMLLYNSNVMHKLRNVPFYLHIASFRGLLVHQNFLYIICFTTVADVYLVSHSLELIREFV